MKEKCHVEQEETRWTSWVENEAGKYGVEMGVKVLRS